MRGITAVLLKPVFEIVESIPQGLDDAVRFFKRLSFERCGACFFTCYNPTMTYLRDRAIGSFGSMKINIWRCQYTPGEQLRNGNAVGVFTLPYAIRLDQAKFDIGLKLASRFRR